MVLVALILVASLRDREHDLLDEYAAEDGAPEQAMAA